MPLGVVLFNATTVLEAYTVPLGYDSFQSFFQSYQVQKAPMFNQASQRCKAQNIKQAFKVP